MFRRVYHTRTAFVSPLCFVVRRGGPLADDDGLDAVLSGGGARGGGRGGDNNLDPAALLIVYCMVVDCGVLD